MIATQDRKPIVIETKLSRPVISIQLLHEHQTFHRVGHTCKRTEKL